MVESFMLKDIIFFLYVGKVFVLAVCWDYLIYMNISKSSASRDDYQKGSSSLYRMVSVLF